MIGVLFGFLSALFYRYFDLHKHAEAELSFFLIIALCPYYASEVCGFSGIMSVLFTGIIMDHYTYYHLSSTTRVTLTQVTRMMATILENFVFVYLGMAMFDE